MWINLTGEEFAKMDKVIMNQTYAESKSKVQGAIVFQHASVIWPSHSPEDVAMRTLGAWAITQYRNNGKWTDRKYWCFPCLARCCGSEYKDVRLELNKSKAPATRPWGGAAPGAAGVVVYSGGKILCGIEPPHKPRAGMLTIPCGKKERNETIEQTAVRETREEGGIAVAEQALRYYKTFDIGNGACKLYAVPATEVTGVGTHADQLLNLAYRDADEIRAFNDDQVSQALKQCLVWRGGFRICPDIFTLPENPLGAQRQPIPTNDALPTPSAPALNELGYVEPGHGNNDRHILGGATDDDSEIRALREDRVLVSQAGVGVIGQSTTPNSVRQIVGVVSLPITDPPNVYAKEAANVQSAIDNRITKKQRPFTANVEDKRLIGLMVSAAIGASPKKSLFSTLRVVEWWKTRVIGDCKSGKWTTTRMQNTVESLLTRIDPQFKLSCDVKLEPMPEGKAPRMIIADGDEGQVLALLTICCIEDLIKAHLPLKTIKGVGKSDAMDRVAPQLRIPKAAQKRTQTKGTPPGVSVFEGDGSAWDTTCSASLRDHVENPVILHVGAIMKLLMVEPPSWITSHE
jgi:8-oxo-dGTP pyrophosphatase MutT (NUDIX family)